LMEMKDTFIKWPQTPEKLYDVPDVWQTDEDKNRRLWKKNIFNHILTIMITNSLDIYTVLPVDLICKWLETLWAMINPQYQEW
jgi:hypothetical protein